MPYKSSVNLGLPNLPDPPDPKFFAEFTRVYNSIRNLALALDAYTGALAQDYEYFSQTTAATSVLTQNTQRLYVPVSEPTTYGQVVNLYDVAGVCTARLASAATSAKPMHAWCSTVGGADTGEYCEVMLGGLCTAIGSLTSGVLYYLSNTDGAISSTPGVVSQIVGFALGTTYLFVAIEFAGGGGVGSIADGDKGDIVVSSSGTVWELDAVVEAALLDRANHTGTQTAATVVDFSEAVDDRVSALLVAGTNITLTYNDGAGSLTIDAAAGAPGSAVSATVTVTVPANSYTHSELVTFTGCTGTMVVVASIAPHVDTDENDPDLLLVQSLSASPGTNEATIQIAFLEPTSGPVKINLVAV